MSVGEEHLLGSAVSDKCQIEGFTAHGLLPGGWCRRRLQPQETSELSEALRLPLHFLSFSDAEIFWMVSDLRVAV